MTFLQELECDTYDKYINLNPFEMANGYTQYAFKITDKLIGFDIYGQQFKSAT